ncbi:glycosyltransferase family 2 protein [Algoriphagus sp. AK58]|uniref:glycosyltransferase family 2 protein n=1 Tax=Algoriphagus sp. AK58 TaxID=1406877 RepID=UPI00165032D1|nr:glycosyltransferase family 2 protein [Algoriphagus sp. AK58]MBC6369021.1 glycosyl transferase [Algoriphagus sp. AK58]
MISIIVPNYNHQKFLPQRLDTIFNQTFQDFEVILLDDCSTDDSWEYLKQFDDHPKVSHCIRNEFNSGSPFKQWKKGIDLAKYDWIWIAESDDFSELDFLEKLVFKIEDGISLIFSKSNFVDELGETYYISGKKFEMNDFELGEFEFRKNGIEFIRNYLVYRNYLLNASSVLFKKPDTFPEEVLDMKFSGDWFFWLFRLKIGEVVYIPRVLNCFRFHEKTTRSPKDERIELARFSEGFSCILFSHKIIKKKSILFLFDENYSNYSFYYFKLIQKYGRLRFQAVFPRIPIFMYLNYFKFFIKSFF